MHGRRLRRRRPADTRADPPPSTSPKPYRLLPIQVIDRAALLRLPTAQVSVQFVTSIRLPSFSRPDRTAAARRTNHVDCARASGGRTLSPWSSRGRSRRTSLNAPSQASESRIDLRSLAPEAHASRARDPQARLRGFLQSDRQGRRDGLSHLRRRFTGGVLKDGGKTDRSACCTPAEGRARRHGKDADTARLPLRFPAPLGGHIDIEKSAIANGRRAPVGGCSSSSPERPPAHVRYLGD